MLVNAEAYRRVADLVREMEADAAAERERTGIEPPGPAAIRAQKPHDRPNKLKKSPAPFCHAASRAVCRELRLPSPSRGEMKTGASPRAFHARVSRRAGRL
jgi:hypothetical protein